MRLAGLEVDAARVELAWRTWRADPKAAVVFRDAESAVGAAAASGARGVLVCGCAPALNAFLKHVAPRMAHEVDTGAAPPCRLAPDDVRFLARPASCADNMLMRADFVIVLLDAALAFVKQASAPVSFALRRSTVALVSDWWPEGAPVAASFLGARPVLDQGLGELPRPAVRRLTHPPIPVAAPLARVVLAERDPVAGLARLRSASVRLGERDVPYERSVLVVEHSFSRSCAERIAAAVRPRLAVVALLDDVLRGEPPALGPGDWTLVFAAEPLVEYHERAAVRAFRRAGASIVDVVTHSWTADGNAARVDGWGAPPPAAARAALAAACTPPARRGI